ncbi:MAG: hypothetical protein A4E53_00803 [Pelotomaculum sp. PtaB.Bin104]|nr:MAG: hypothetical protein A4E53_00803 [Pelotomaculum sp. PtaB.Bin104]
MAKAQVEFINTCPSCAEHVETIKEVAKKYGDDLEVQIYYAGKDVAYLRKYGMVTKGTLIVNGRKKYDALSRAVIEKAINDAVRSGGS